MIKKQLFLDFMYHSLLTLAVVGVVAQAQDSDSEYEPEEAAIAEPVECQLQKRQGQESHEAN